MSGWRVFWHDETVQPAPDTGLVIALENRIFVSEGEAKQVVRGLVDADFGKVFLRPPGSRRNLKGNELRSWLYPTI